MGLKPHAGSFLANSTLILSFSMEPTFHAETGLHAETQNYEFSSYFLKKFYLVGLSMLKSSSVPSQPHTSHSRSLDSPSQPTATAGGPKPARTWLSTLKLFSLIYKLYGCIASAGADSHFRRSACTYNSKSLAIQRISWTLSLESIVHLKPPLSLESEKTCFEN